MKEIIAEKNGKRRYFTKTQWDVLGTDKCGWVLVPMEINVTNQALTGTTVVPGHGIKVQDQQKHKRRKK